MLIGFILCPSYEEKFIDYLKEGLKFNIKDIILSQDGVLIVDIRENIREIEDEEIKNREKNSENINNQKKIIKKLIKNSIFPYLIFYDFKEVKIDELKKFDESNVDEKNLNEKNEINKTNKNKKDNRIKYEKLLEIIGNDFLEFIRNKIINENIYFNIFSFVEDENSKIDRVIIDRNFSSLLKEYLKKKVSKVTKYFVNDFNLLQFNDFDDYKKERIGLIVFYYKNKLFYSFNLFYNGQKRMKFDKEAPSRSYLKIEEAFKIFCEQPTEYSIVFDLGASPGGWSYSCLKKGATVYAIDNGNLKGKYLQDKIKNYELFHIKYDGFKFNPEKNLFNIKNIKLDRNILISNTKNKLSWFLCDIVEKPEKIVKLAQKWILNKWAYYYIINFKLGYSDINSILNEINKLNFLNYFEDYRFIHLFSDREEITFLGKIKNYNYK